jgi:hypothetical protein
MSSTKDPRFIDLELEIQALSELRNVLSLKQKTLEIGHKLSDLTLEMEALSSNDLLQECKRYRSLERVFLHRENLVSKIFPCPEQESKKSYKCSL